MGCQCGFGGGSGGGGGGTFPPTSPVIAPAWFNLGEFTFEDFATDNTETNIEAYGIPPRGVIHGVLVTPVVQFAGPGLTSYTVACGVPADAERFTAPLDVVAVVPGDTVHQMSAPLLEQFDQAGTTPFWISVESVGVGLDGVTAGEFRLDALISISPPSAS